MGNLDLNDQIENIVKEAAEKTDAAQDPYESKSSKVSGIKHHRDKEKKILTYYESQFMRLGVTL